MARRPPARQRTQAHGLRRRVLALAVAVAALASGACEASLWTGAGQQIMAKSAVELPANHPPLLTLPAAVRGGVGVVNELRLEVSDGDGDPLVVEAEGVPAGAVVARDGRGWVLRWTPSAAGTQQVSVRATDPRGGTSVATVELVARHPAHPAALVALGDSVASGHGLELSDYLGRDRCWRAGDDSYPGRVLRALEEGGHWPEGSELALVACSGARAHDLLVEPVSGGLDGTGGGEAELSQVDWAVRANPALVTITVGANDLGFSSPWELVREGSLDLAEVDRRLAGLGDSLREVLRRLVDETDAIVVVTGYYDPSAARPQGFDGCRGACFSAAVTTALDRLNATIADAVEATGSPRVRVADVREAFAGHGAPNGLGPDGLRSGGWGLLGRIVGPLTSGTHPYCAKGHPGGDPWVNSVDCVHPDGKGAQAIADAVVAAYLGE